jgi:predicted site-specific integrase-resolvase
MRFVTSREACKSLGVHPNTLRKFADENKIGTIKTPSGHRRYNIDSFIGIGKRERFICYCRVSSGKQRDDLQRQEQFMRSKFPTYEIVSDVGSGINFKRKGLNSILESAMQGYSITLVVAFKDRLARFGFELIKQIIEFNGGKLLVLDKVVFSPEEELTRDLVNIIHMFSCRMHGLRNYKNKIDKDLPKQ